MYIIYIYNFIGNINNNKYKYINFSQKEECKTGLECRESYFSHSTTRSEFQGEVTLPPPLIP